MLKEKDKVRYVGQNRPALKLYEGVVERVSTFNNSALVNWYRDGRIVSTDWVGPGGLEKVEQEVTAQSLLEAELKQITEEYAEVYTRYNSLRTRKLQVENALAALKSTFR